MYNAQTRTLQQVNAELINSNHHRIYAYDYTYMAIQSQCNNYSIGGLRRKPYFMIGWGVYVLCNIALAVIRTPNVETLAAFIFLMTMGFVQV